MFWFVWLVFWGLVLVLGFLLFRVAVFASHAHRDLTSLTNVSQ